MKILYYCQHVLGIGHFFRTLEICKALFKHEITLVTGGSPVKIAMPKHVKEIRLPGLMMDKSFKGLFSVEKNRDPEDVKKERKKILHNIFEKENPSLFLVELYPFGRKAFRFELDPVLKGIKDGSLSKCFVASSLRDILVEKKDTKAYENRVLKILNNYFDAVFIHSDPQILKLDETFSRVDDVKPEIIYTGFVTPKPGPDDRKKIRKKLGLDDDEKFIVASAGGGKVGWPLLKACPDAFNIIKNKIKCRLQIFTGPFMDDNRYKALLARENEYIKIDRFTDRFLFFLAGSDLSVSMGGYNTTMNIIASATPGIIWPFNQNREQRLRAERMAGPGNIKILDETEPEPERLACIMEECLFKKKKPDMKINLDGASNMAKWLDTWEKKLPK